MKLPLSLLFLGALLAAGCAPSAPPLPPSSSIARVDRAKSRRAVPREADDKPENAVIIGAKRPATPAQAALAKRRVDRFLASLNAYEMEALRARGVRHICVPTMPSAGHRGGTTCMAWDTQAQEFVGNNAYDLINPPPTLTVLDFPAFRAVYVGQETFERL